MIEPWPPANSAPPPMPKSVRKSKPNDWMTTDYYTPDDDGTAVKGRVYSVTEDLAMLRFIAQKDLFDSIKESRIWRDMERRDVCPGRTHISMKAHFFHVMMRGSRLDDFKKFQHWTNISEAQYKRFELEKSVCQQEDWLSSHYGQLRPIERGLREGEYSENLVESKKQQILRIE